jgi:hypothetical protein
LLGCIGHFRNFDHEKRRIMAWWLTQYELTLPMYDTRGDQKQNPFPHHKSIQMVTLEHYRELYYGVDTSYLQYEPNFNEDVYEDDTCVFPSKIQPMDSNFLPRRRSSVYDVVSC